MIPALFACVLELELVVTGKLELALVALEEWLEFDDVDDADDDDDEVCAEVELTGVVLDTGLADELAIDAEVPCIALDAVTTGVGVGVVLAALVGGGAGVGVGVSDVGRGVGVGVGVGVT
jgi:hypothetical protein